MDYLSKFDELEIRIRQLEDAVDAGETLSSAELFKLKDELYKLKIAYIQQDKEIDRLEKVVHDQAEQYYDCEQRTAKEICDLILEHWEKKQFVECDWLRMAIGEKYGVEVE